MVSAAIGEPETAAWASHFAAMASEIPEEQALASPAGLVSLLVSRPHSDLCTASGSFYAYRKKGKWQAAAKQAGLSKTDADQLNDGADQHYSNCCAAWTELLETVASTVLTDLLTETREVIDRFRKYKRNGAQLDFDDLIYAARDLLRDNEAVREALGARYRHVLVDEFQDTDPLQTEIFWRLCGDPEGDSADWRAFRIRPGALFLVGDPKQAIYRFRGADVSAYTEARDTFQAARPDNVVAISTNFRSCKAILTFVNERFELVLSANGQPGFTPLDHVHEDRADSICVAALDIAVADANGKAAAEVQRDGEAEAVADLCSRMIGSYQVTDRKSGTDRLCQPGDIALLAPTGAELWRYEEALERRGIPVATQAGKGFYRRQEIQDLIALARVLADRRDTLALGALLRGPLVGLTEEELLDIVWSLPRSEAEPDRLPRLDLLVDPETICHQVGRDVIRTLQALFRRANGSTPYDLLSQAIDAVRVRPILLERHRGQAERALANVDLFLNLASAYSVRGLRAFAEAMISAWTEEERAVEGRPDAQEEAVALYTMHAAKGLEWPVVIPINTMTKLMAGDSAVIDRSTDTLYVPVMGVAPAGYDSVKQLETNELDRERVRLWYVAATRARELLVVPRLDAPPARGPAWISLIDLSLGTLPAIDLSHLPNEVELVLTDQPNRQTREIFAAGAERIAAGRKIVTWLAPSRGENVSDGFQSAASTEIWTDTADGVSPPLSITTVQGGRERGLILHKLLEEVISGELADSTGELIRRATDLIGALGMIPGSDASKQLSPAELADCVRRTLALPEISRLRPDLLAEYPVYGSTVLESEIIARAGIADAVTLNSSGKPSIIIDWKSDVQPDIATLDHYRAQVGDYLRMTGADTGLIVLVSSGTVISVPKPADPSLVGAEH